MTDRTFGAAQAGISYAEQREAYLIALDRGNVHVIRKAGKYYLPGQKNAENTSHEDTILQACIDTTGFDVCVDNYIADADLYDQDNRVHSVRTYYSGAFLEQITPPANQSVSHEQLSLSDIDRLALEIDRWAVTKGIEMLRTDAHGSDDEGL